MHKLIKDKVYKPDGIVVEKVDSIVGMVNHQSSNGPVAAMVGEVAVGYVRHIAKSRSCHHILSIDGGAETLSIHWRDFIALPDLPIVIDQPEFFNVYVPEKMMYRSTNKKTGEESFMSPICLLRTQIIAYPPEDLGLYNVELI